MDQWRQVIPTVLGLAAAGARWHRVSGGDIADAHRLDCANRTVFCKTTPAKHRPLLTAEASGLALLRQTGYIRVPEVLGEGIAGSRAWLALEWLELQSRNQKADATLGARLADMHRVTHDRHGLDADNFIGRTPQRNKWQDNWIDFFRQCRLMPQLEMLEVRQSGWLEGAQSLFDRLPGLFSGYQPQPSLLHGDLWSGNAAMLKDGTPVIYDPAVYFGDREADLAMCELFGGFSPDFYAAYEHAWPLDVGYHRRKPLYQLYHLMNHANLFGGHYFHRVRSVLQQITGEPPHSPE